MSVSLYKKTLEETLSNKQKRLEGKHISIPFPFPRLSEYFPGIMPRRYYLVTANSKVGKTKICDFLFVTCPYLFTKNVPTNIRVRVKYFSLEMSKEDKIKEVRSFLLFYKHGISLPPDVLDSIYNNRILDDKVERIIKSDEFLQWFEEYESIVEYIDHTKNPFGIFKHIREYAHKHGTYYNKEANPMDMSLPLKIDQKGYKFTEDDRIELEKFYKDVSYYKFNHEDVFVIIIVDHARLLTIEEGFDDRRNIENFSSNYLMAMRDRWSFIPVMVQQQAASQESIENLKADKLRPSPDGLGISKNTQQDADVILGLFSPARHGKLTWNQYDISRMKDKYREFEILLNRRGNTARTNLYFNGASNFFKELPSYNEMTPLIYQKIDNDNLDPKII